MIKFYQSTSGSNDRFLYNLEGTIDSLQKVVYRHTKRDDGKFWVEILLDGSLKYQFEDTTPTCLENVKLYSSNPWDHASPATIQNLKITTTSKCEILICITISICKVIFAVCY